MIKGFTAEMKADKIKTAIREYKRTQDRIVEQNRADFMRNAKPGQVIPSFIKLSDSSKSALNSAIGRARDIIDKEINDSLVVLSNDIAEAPSDEAIRALQVANMRTSITADEIDFMMNKYGKNVQAYNALKDIAAKHKYHNFKSDQTLQQFQDLSHVSSVLHGINTLSVENGKITDGYIATLESNVNNAFGLNEDGKAE